MSRRWIALPVIVLVLGPAALALRAARKDGFPHARHDGLFPVCTGCHQGVPAGDVPAFFPEPVLCAECHDGVEVKRVEWSGPERAATNLSFSHPKHDAATEASGDVTECVTCHTPAGAGRMEVRHAVVEQCLDCHAHEAEVHQVDAECTTCHVPLAETRFATSRIANLPRPDTHADEGFLARLHGELAREEPSRCAVCHTRETCSACHVNAATSEAIATVPAAGSRLQLPPLEARYFEPASHERPDFPERHGRLAGDDAAACATCHTRESCTTCHGGELPRAVTALPGRAPTVAPGVTTRRRPPASHEAPFYAREHGTVASAEAPSCTNCHTRLFCEDCHSAPPAGRSGAPGSALEPTTRRPTAGRRTPPGRTEFHPADFLARHASTAYGRTLECSNCHDTRVFCRDCHQQSGFRASGRLNAGFHDADPFWLLRHPQAARQGLESCASCHAQRDCMQCHSEMGAFRINPHGPDFDSRRAADRNAVICSACHLSDPLPRSIP